MLYDNYIQRLSNRFLTELESIKVGYNFDYGDEYEIAVCRVLRLVLPSNFGICRGFVVSQNGDQAGDDIIIFDRQRFPSLGLRDENDFSRKEFIPIEAVFGYIEAKYTLNLIGDDGQSFAKATTQVQTVKTLCNTRKRVEIGQLRHVDLGTAIKGYPDWPEYRNPSWGAVFASRIRDKKDGKILESFDDINAILKKTMITGDNRPDLLVLGSDICTIPVFRDNEKGIDTLSHFSVEPKTVYLTKHTPGSAPGVGLSVLLGAFDWILLGALPWKQIVGEALGSKENAS